LAPTYPCELNFCQFRFCSKSHLDSHKLTHNQDNLNVNSLFHKGLDIFDTLSKSDIHAYLWKCTFNNCGLEFASKDLLVKHIHSSHHNLIICDDKNCGALMIEISSNLYLQKKEHLCLICKKQFTRNGSVKRHMMIHTNEKPFECTIPGCDQKFNQKCNLISHLNLFHKGGAIKKKKTNQDEVCDQKVSFPEIKNELNFSNSGCCLNTDQFFNFHFYFLKIEENLKQKYPLLTIMKNKFI